MKFDAVFFDLDGTLLNTLDDLADSVNDALEELAFPRHPVESYKYFVGNGMEKLISRALPEEVRDDADVHSRCMTRAGENYAANWNAKSRPYPGVPETLNALAEAAVPCCVLSNKPHPFTAKIVDTLFSSWKFRLVYGARPGIPKKPDPTAVQGMLSELDLDPARCAFVGDTWMDMQTAVNAGMMPVGVLWGFREREELLEGGAKYLAGDGSSLIRILLGQDLAD